MLKTAMWSAPQRGEREGQEGKEEKMQGEKERKAGRRSKRRGSEMKGVMKKSLSSVRD